MKKLLYTLVLVWSTLFNINQATAQCHEVTLSITDIDCITGSLGSFEALITGGVAPYTYSLEGGSFAGTTSDSVLVEINLDAGFYVLHTEDANGCLRADTFEIQQQTSYDADIVVVSSDCNEFCLGVNTVGGTPPFEYAWSNGETDSTACYPGGSFVTVTISDATGCIEILDQTVTTPNPIVVTGNIQEVTCAGSADGCIDVTVSGGLAPYTYTWNNGLNIEDPCGLDVGAYSVTVTDTEGCTAIFDVFLDGPLPLEVVISTVDVSCSGSNDGVIVVEVIGGFPPYFYEWSNGAQGPIVDGLSSGIYSVTVIDANGCTVTVTATIAEPPLTTAFTTLIDSDCDGEIPVTIILQDTFPQFEIVEEHIPGGPQYTLLSGDTTTITVTDQNGCDLILEIAVLPNIELDLSITSSGCDSTSGGASITLDPAITNFEVNWSNGVSGVLSQNSLAPGGYSVTVTDLDAECTGKRVFEIAVEDSCIVEISGFVYIDEETGGCIVDTTSIPAPNILVTLSDGQSMFTDLNGYYSFETNPGSHTISVAPPVTPFLDLCTADIQVDLPNGGMSISDQNFYYGHEDQADVAIQVIQGVARPGFAASVDVFASNFSLKSVTATVVLYYDPIREYTATNPMGVHDPNNQTVTWDISLAPNSTIFLDGAFYTDPSVNLGTILVDSARITIPITDTNLSNNLDIATREVTGSYDPNDKQVFPTGDGPDGNIFPGDEDLSYLIRFQNTGTDTAFTVVIRDTLDENLDIETLRPGASSHSYELRILPNRILEFTFDNILLPDSSTNQLGSNGYVWFDIRLKDNLTFGTLVENTAAIYFDFNPPIITNTTKSTFTMPVNTNDLDALTEISLAPNPGRQPVLSIDLAEAQRMEVVLRQLDGRVISTLMPPQLSNAGTHQIQVQQPHLPEGLYFIECRGTRGVQVLKWIR